MNNVKTLNFLSQTEGLNPDQIVIRKVLSARISELSTVNGPQIAALSGDVDQLEKFFDPWSSLWNQKPQFRELYCFIVNWTNACR